LGGSITSMIWVGAAFITVLLIVGFVYFGKVNILVSRSAGSKAED
jgi:hypothetical protein